MEEGFIEANSDILPKVSVDMVVRFLAASTEIKKCVGESYGDTAIRFVQIKRSEGLCTVKSRVSPEHAVTAEAAESYRVTAVIREHEDSVQACRCEDCAYPDACRHAAAFLLWLHRRSEAPATSTISYWEPAPVSSPEDLKPFMTLKEMLGIKDSTEDCSDSTVFEEFMKEAKERNIDCPLVRHYFPENNQVLGLHRLCVSLRGVLHCPQALLQALVAEMTAVEESDVTPWPEIWYGRIKDSMLHEAVHCPDLKSDLVDRILGENLKYTSDEVDRRNITKKAVLEEVSRKEKIQITEAGVLLNAEYPVLGAAPEGVTDEYTVEVKCPTTKETLLSYVKDNKLAMELWTQVQAQMYFSKKRKALLCVAQPDFATSRRVEVFRVPFDQGVVRVLDGAQQFWVDAIFPELLAIYKS